MTMRQTVLSPVPHRPPATRRQPASLTAMDLLSATAGRRIQARRTNRHRTVFVYRPPVDPPEESSDEPSGKRSAITARLYRLRNHEPFSPVGGTAMRPMTDAANTLTILREILRGSR